MTTQAVPTLKPGQKPQSPKSHLDISQLNATTDPPVKTPSQTVAKPTDQQPQPLISTAAHTQVAPTLPTAEDDEITVPAEYCPPDEDGDAGGPVAVLDAAADFEMLNDNEEPAQDESDEPAITAISSLDASKALTLANQFMAQRDEVIAGLRTSAAGKRQEAEVINTEAQEKIKTLNNEADQIESIANNMGGIPNTNVSHTTTKRPRRRQGQPNITNDSASPVAAPGGVRNTAISKEQAREMNKDKTVKRGIIWVLTQNKCVSPAKVMSLKPITVQIVTSIVQNGYGYHTASEQFSNIVRGQLDKLESEDKLIIFSDESGGYYLNPNPPKE